MITTIHNRQELSRFLQTYRCVLKASAGWCRPCKEIALFYQRLSDTYAALWFGEFDVDKARDVADFYQTQAMPTFYLIQEGKVVQQLKGPSQQELLNAVSAFSRI